MKRLLTCIFLLFCFLGVSSTISSCKTGEGCGLEEKYGPETNKDGSLKKTKRKKAKLF